MKIANREDVLMEVSKLIDMEMSQFLDYISNKSQEELNEICDNLGQELATVFATEQLLKGEINPEVMYTKVKVDSYTEMISRLNFFQAKIIDRVELVEHYLDDVELED